MITGLNETQSVLIDMIEDADREARWQDQTCDGYLHDIISRCESIRKDIDGGLHTSSSPIGRAGDLEAALTLRTEKHRSGQRLRWALVRSLTTDQLRELLTDELAKHPEDDDAALTDYEQAIVERIVTNLGNANPLARPELVLSSAKLDAFAARRSHDERTNR